MVWRLDRLGRLGGRRKSLTKEKRKMVFDLYQGKQYPIQEICNMFGITKPTLYKYVAEFKSE